MSFSSSGTAIYILTYETGIILAELVGKKGAQSVKAFEKPATRMFSRNNYCSPENSSTCDSEFVLHNSRRSLSSISSLCGPKAKARNVGFESFTVANLPY